MAHPRCPKCGTPGPIEDECPGCGVYISKYLALQERRAAQGLPPLAGHGDSALGPVVLPGAPAASPAARPSRTGALVTAGIVLVVYAAVGYVVLHDWFGAAFDYTPPPGWVQVGDDQLEAAVDQVATPSGGEKTILAVYTLQGDTGPFAPGIAIAELEKVVPIDPQTTDQIRTRMQAVRQHPAFAGMPIPVVGLREFGGRPALEIAMDIDMQGLRWTMHTVTIGADHSMFLVMMVGPTDVLRPHLQPFTASLASFRVLAPQGLRGATWFKYGLRWFWVTAGVGLLMLAYVRWRG